MTDRVHVLVGTKKGGFVYTSDAKRRSWELSDPILPGWTIHSMAADLRDAQPRFYAAANHWAWGPSAAKSTDLIEWDYRSQGLAFPPDMKSPSIHPFGEWNQAKPGTIGNVWEVVPGHKNEPGVVYAATQPAGLFRSEDSGQSWTPIDSFNNHESRKYWSGTGGGDSCVHSVQVDPRDSKRVYACVSAGGSFKSSDGGQTWQMFTHNAVPTSPEALKIIKELEGASPELLENTRPPDRDPAGLDELHLLAVDQKDPDRMWGQAHWGVFRSQDNGDTWVDVTEGLPSFHGFPIAVTKKDKDAAFVVPLDYGQDNFRVAPGQFAVYRSQDSGATWERLTNGLPGPGDYQSVYREGLDTDGLDSEGVYVGTSNGQVFASSDRGDSWQRLPGTLPPVLSVTAVAM